MADKDLTELLARMAATRVPRRSFLAASGYLGIGATLAACGAGAATPAPSAAPATPTPTGDDPVPPTEAPATAEVTPAPAVESELWMLNWSEYDDPENMEAFKAEYGVQNFQYDIFSSDDELQAKLAAGATGYDIAAPTALFLPVMVQNGYIQKLDYSRIPNFKHIDPNVLGQPWDPNNEYHIPKDFGTTGILVRSKLVPEPVTSWREFYDLAKGKYSGKIVLADSALDILPMPLKMLGYSLNSTDPKELAEAKDLLLDLAPHILALDSDTYGDKLASGEAVMAVAWTGPLADLRADPETADIKYVIPSEGTLFWLDGWVLMADAPHPNAAYAWFDFVERPEVQAKEAIFTGYATPNLEAAKLLPPEFLNDPAIFPPAEVMSLLEGADPNAASNEARLEVWTEFKSRIGSAG